MIFRPSMGRIARRGAILLVAASLASAASNCDLNLDGSVNVIDVQLITNMVSLTATCVVNIAGANICTDPVRTVVINAIFGAGCHAVSLNWVASTSSSAVGYNIYRGTTTGGPYTKVNSSVVVGTTYIDSTALAGQTYYYVARAVDGSGKESQNSGEAPTAVPASAS